jgi:UrcA family protein
MNMKSIKFLLPIAALALSAVATAATRADDRIVVKYGDLNLASEAGVANLLSRIRNAAESVCGQQETRILALRGHYVACVEEAVSRTVAAVDDARLTSFHLEHGTPPVLAAIR